MNIEERLERVERQNRHFQFLIGILLCVATLSPILGLASRRDIPEVIRARAFHVVSADGNVLVALEDTLGLNTGRFGSILTQNRDGGSIVEIWQTSRGEGTISTLNEKGKYLVKIGANEEGNGTVLLFDNKGRDLAKMGSLLQQSETNNKVTPKTSGKYKILSIDDVSFGQTRRYNVRVRVGQILKATELKQVSEEIITDLKNSKPHNALSIFYYLPNSDPKAHYTAGMADWAPFGDWSKAGEVQTGDYSKHLLSIKIGNATGINPSAVKVSGLSISRKKRVFFDLVKAQDDGVGDVKAYEIIAKKYRISVELVRKIGVEGVVNGWPMP